MDNKIYKDIHNMLKDKYQLVKKLDSGETAKDNRIYLYRSRENDKNTVVHINNYNPDTYSVYSLLKIIRHNHIIQVHDVFETDGRLVVIEEYIDGCTLYDLLYIKGTFQPMNPIGVKRLLLQLCDGLYALHSMGIIHRDIKPENIMLTNNGTVKIIDFDSAKLYKSSETADRSTAGTRGYAPPEQLGLIATDERSDIYAVGILANILLTGKFPLTDADTYKKGRLGRLIKKCTNINLDKRFRSADKLFNFIR